MKNLTFKAAMLNDSRTTVERRSTDGQSQRHYKQTPLSKRWKVLMTLVFLFTFAIGQMWAEDFTITPINGSYCSPGNLAKVTLASNSSASSGRVDVKSSKTGGFTISTNAPGLYLKEVTFTDSQYSGNKKGTITCESGGTLADNSGNYTLTPSTNATSATIEVKASTSGDCKITNLSIKVTNGTTNNIETLSGFTKSGDDFSFSATCNGTSVTPSVGLSSSTWTASGNNISAQSSNDSKTITVTSSNSIKYIAFYDSNCRMGIVEKSSTGGTVSGAAWTAPTEGSVKSVTFKNSIGSSMTITKVFVITEAAATHALTWNFDGGSCSATAGTDYTAGGQVAEGATITYPAAETMSKTNKDFAGWSTSVTTMPTSDLKITAQWVDHVAKYTVKYMDGSTVLDTKEVTVGQHPAGLASDPTKDCYTFAAWSPALNTVSGTDGQVVNVNATWTPNYANTVDLTAAAVKDANPRPNVNTYITGFNYVSSITFDISKYEYTSNETKPGYYGYKVNTANDKLKFLVQQGKQVKVLFGSLKNVPTIKVNNVSKSLDANRTEGDMAENTFTYTASAEDALVEITFGSGTSTLKKIDICSLYNATYTTSKSSVDPTSASNVTEVTLPTPSETTVGGYSFTGWVADKTVYDDEENEKTAGADLTAGKTYTLTATTEFTAQWALISDFDVKFFQGYGDPDVQIGDKQTISTGNFAVAPADPTRTGFAFLGWSYDATEAHIVDVATYGITAETNFTAMWKQVFTVTFDGEGSVNVESGSKVASPNSPSQAGKVFQGWYNGESKYDFSAAVTANLALTSKWEDANANHFYYNYKDDFHYDGVVYKSPEGKVDNKDGESNKAITTPYTLFSGAAGISSIVATKAIYDSKSNWVNAYLKINTSEDSYLTFTIASGYTAVLKMKMGGYSSDPTITLKKGEETIAATSGTPGGKQASKENDFNEIVYDLVAGTYIMTTATKTLYISHIDLEATALPTFTVTYVPGEGTGDEVVDNDATMVADCPAGFTAPTGKAFNGWKDGDNNDVEVGATVTESMTLTAQWINQYAVTFDMQGHGTAVDPQYIKHGAKATKPADPFVMGWDFGGWFTEATCENEFDFNTAIEAATPLFAKWTEFIGCTMLYPAKSGDAIAVGDPIVMQDGSFGGAMSALAIPEGGALTYNNNGLQFATKTGVKANVVLNNDIVAGTKIILTLVAGGEKTRGLFLYTKDGNKIDDFTCWVDGVNPASNGLEDTFTYTVQAGDGLEGTNEFQLWRNNTVYLKSLKVSSCGDAIIYHDLTSEVNIAGKGTVALGANTVREGHTTTATYSDIDPLYEFVSWSVSGTGASIENATANPATITMGTEDAVVTLNLQLKPVKFTVEYYDGTTLMGSEQVTVNENPTASEIVTAKRHYTFQGWAETDGGDVVALNTITRTEAGTVKLYAKYEAVACPTSGTIFSMESDEAKKPGETVTIAKDASIDLAEYATISGGNAMIINGETSGKDAISEDGEFLLKATNEVMKIELNCVLQEGDIIRIPDNSAKLVISTSNAKTGTYQEFADKNTHEFAVTAAWAGVDDIYVLYNGSSLKFTKVYVIRPAKYDVTFNMMEHGTQIADIEDVLEGSKISAPTAPTDEDYSFAGWYKENTLSDEWKFDVDVVTANTTLYAKWLDKSDATLKSLKYGAEEITLQAGIYTYNVELPALTTAVPALSAETSNPNATKVITNATAFDAEGHATSKVVVTPEKVGAATQTYTVNFAKAAEIALQNVTGSIPWDFSKSGITAETNIPSETVMANIPAVNNDENFWSDKIQAGAGKLRVGYYQGGKLMFHTTVPGLLKVEFSNTGSSTRPYRELLVNGNPTGAKSKDNTHVTYTVAVKSGDIELTARIYNNDGNPTANTSTLNFFLVDFDADLSDNDVTEDAFNGYTREITAAGQYGTICLPNGGVMVGAAIFEVAYMTYQNNAPYKVFFDEVLSGEMVAGRPYIFMPNENVAKIAVFYTDNANAGAGEYRGLHGTYTQMDGAALQGKYIFYNNTIFMSENQANWLNENRAYIVLSEVQDYETPASAGRRRVSMGVNAPAIATGLENVQGGNVQATKVLINGQLYILRGEKMYDAKGQLVK